MTDYRPAKSLADIAAEQGIVPVEPADHLAGPPIPDEEWAPFEAAIRECRGEQACGTPTTRPSVGRGLIGLMGNPMRRFAPRMLPAPPVRATAFARCTD